MYLGSPKRLQYAEPEVSNKYNLLADNRQDNAQIGKQRSRVLP